jgi:hypothetical protein
MFMGESLAAVHQDTIVASIFTYLLNFTSNSMKPIIHYAQICAILIGDKPEFRAKIEDRIKALSVKLDFETCRLLPSLIEFSIYLNSQLDQ